MTPTLQNSWRLARRELRSGLQGLWIFFACLVLGVAAIAMIGTVSASLERGMIEQGQPLLGGDMEFSVIHRTLNKNELAFLKSLGKVSRIATMRAIAIAGNKRTLVEVKAADDLWPLYGALELDHIKSGKKEGKPDFSKNNRLWRAFGEKTLLARLAIRPGDVIRLGAARFIIADTIAREPDRIADGFILGPRLLISQKALAATGLAKPGSLIRWHYRIALADQNADIADIKKTAGKLFPDAGWRIRSRDRAAPGAERFISRLSFFLTLTGLTALIVGGAGMANAVRTFLSRRQANIATLKCLGASSAIILVTYLAEILVIATLAIATGLAIGALAPLAATPLLAKVLPLPVLPAIAAGPLAAAAAFGFLVTIAFCLWPLASAARTPASRLFRGAPDATATALPAKRYMAISLMALAGLAGLALVIFPDRLITTWYILGVTGGFVLLSGLGQALKAIARRMPRPKNAVLSLAISSLHRPGAPTTSIILSLGLGLALFVTLALVAGNVSSELKSALPREAPSFFFLDVQNTRLDEFRRFLDTQPGVVKTATAPMLRGKVQKLNGNPVDMKNIAAHVRWAFRGDRGLTYSATIPEGSSLTKGKWWPQDYTGPPLVSFVDEIANGAGLEIGDTVTVNILGRNVTATIASLRKVDWESLRLNFVMVFSPGTLKGAPHTSLVTVTMDKNRTDAAGNEDRLLAAISDKYPAVTAVRIKDALDAVNNLLSKLLTAIRSASALAMMTGILVLAGALSSGLSARIRNAVILKTFGATRRQLIGAFVLEYALTGFITAVFAIAAGSLAAWAIIHFIMEMSWTFSFSTAAVTALAAVILTVPAGLATTWSALAAKPARVLRME